MVDKNAGEHDLRYQALENPLLAEKVEDIIEDHLEEMMASSETNRRVHKDFEKMRSSQVIRS